MSNIDEKAKNILISMVRIFENYEKVKNKIKEILDILL